MENQESETQQLRNLKMRQQLEERIARLEERIVRLQERIVQLQERTLHVQRSLTACVSTRDSQSTPMSYAARATLAAIAERLKTVENQMRENVAREAQLARERQNVQTQTSD